MHNLSLFQLDQQNYTINFNNKIFLEINEIIAIQDTIFKVLGNNILICLITILTFKII